MCDEASSLESCDCSAALSARSLVRSEFAESSARLRRRTATFTNTTPASRTPLTTIQTMPPRARAWTRLRRRRARTTGSVTVACACETLANLRSHSQTRGLRARVAGDLGSAGTHRLARRRAHRRLGAADADGEVGRARAALLLPAEELLHGAIPERVERDHAEPAAGPEHLERGRQRSRERAELVVPLDPQRLEDALGGVTLTEARRRRDRGLDHLDEVACPLEGSAPAALDDRACDLACVALFTVTLEDFGELPLFSFIDELTSRVGGTGIHAHVERRVDRVREAAVGAVELHQRHPEIEQDHVGADAVLRQVLEHRRELAAVQAGLHARLAAKTVEVRRDGWVAVDRNQLPVAAQPRREQRRVAAGAERGV